MLSSTRPAIRSHNVRGSLLSIMASLLSSSKGSTSSTTVEYLLHFASCRGRIDRTQPELEFERGVRVTTRVCNAVRARRPRINVHNIGSEMIVRFCHPVHGAIRSSRGQLNAMFASWPFEIRDLTRSCLSASNATCGNCRIANMVTSIRFGFKFLFAAVLRTF
jgi:hypothetical protein